jgi:hypothetical protein
MEVWSLKPTMDLVAVSPRPVQPRDTRGKATKTAPEIRRMMTESFATVMSNLPPRGTLWTP